MRFHHVAVLILLVATTGCTLRNTDDTAIPSTIITVTDGINSCVDVITAALQQPPCNITDGAEIPAN